LKTAVAPNIFLNIKENAPGVAFRRQAVPGFIKLEKLKKEEQK
jgi:hypothetical protein